MKLKKFAAVAMAAVMSLAMFTACSGGGGGSSTKGTAYTRETVVIKEGNQTYTEETGKKKYVISNGIWSYSRETSVLSNRVSESLSSITGNKGKAYTVNTKDDNAWKAYYVTDVTIKNIKKEDGTEDEYKTSKITITCTIQGRDFTATETYYYEKSSNTLKYIKNENDGVVTIEKVLRDTSGVDSANAAKLDINKYTIVKNIEDLG